MKSKIDVVFYHFTVTPLLAGLPRLIKKIYESNQRLLVLCSSEQEMSDLDNHLWTFSSKEFIPHGTTKEDGQVMQPVLLSTSCENKNGAENILILNDMVIDDIGGDFKKYVYAFYGNVEEVQGLMQKYEDYKMQDDVFNTMFWRQSKEGRWEKLSYTSSVSEVG